MKRQVADSDLDAVEVLAEWLKSRGYAVHLAFPGERARMEWVRHHPDLAMLDHSLDQAIPTATSRGSRDTRDESDGGMPARIYSLSRRARSALARNPKCAAPSIVRAGPITLDALRHIALVRDKAVRLTPTESKIMLLLAANVNTACTLDQIVSHVWGCGSAGDACLIKAHVRHLREKLETNPSHPRYIITVPGIGYSLCIAPEETGAKSIESSDVANAVTATDASETEQEKIVPVRSGVTGA